MIASRNQRIWIVVGVCIVATVAMFFATPIPQDPDYHNFVDSRNIFGVANFWNVVSNLGFLLVGVAGLMAVYRFYRDGIVNAFTDHRELIAYAVFFIGVGLTAFGSAYYHYNPGNATLLWDRLPMTLVFMSLLAVIVSECVSMKRGQQLLWPLIVVGIVSVLYWYYTETIGRGDLRLYAVVQFLPLIIIPFILSLFPSIYTHRSYFLKAEAWYVLAKILEVADERVYSLGGWVSGHTLKHVAIAIGWLLIIQMLRVRKTRPTEII